MDSRSILLAGVFAGATACGAAAGSADTDPGTTGSGGTVGGVGSDGSHTGDGGSHPHPSSDDSGGGSDGGSEPTPCAGGIMCGSLCVDPSLDRDNCGECDHPCGDDEVCTDGTCDALPESCPADGCPDGSYCDLVMDKCIPGCLQDVECSPYQSCEDRTCTTCPSSLGNCDVPAEDGCETNLQTSDLDCGACGHSCSADRTCMSGSCECAGTTTECDGECVDTATDDDHCGQCGHACPTIAHGANTCSGSACHLACNGGYHDCNGSCVSDDAVATCGSSCSPCTAPAHASPTCDGTSCGFACDSGYVPCDDGCCEDCATAGCTGFTWCNPDNGLCEEGCTHQSQCDGGNEFCWLEMHTCEQTVDTSCPSGYSYFGECSNGVQFCVHSGVPSGTTHVFANDCPAGTTSHGTFYCSDYTYICIPND